MGQVTPGPVFTTATFIGYVLNGLGLPGAMLATVGIFLPSFVFVAVSGPLVPRLRKSPIAGAFLDGVNVASLALMAVVTWQLGRAAVFDLPTAFLLTAAALLLFRFRVNSAWLILGGALLGVAVQAAHLGAYEQAVNVAQKRVPDCQEALEWLACSAGGWHFPERVLHVKDAAGVDRGHGPRPGEIESAAWDDPIDDPPLPKYTFPISPGSPTMSLYASLLDAP